MKNKKAQVRPSLIVIALIIVVVVLVLGFLSQSTLGNQIMEKLEIMLGIGGDKPVIVAQNEIVAYNIVEEKIQYYDDGSQVWLDFTSDTEKFNDKKVFRDQLYEDLVINHYSKNSLRNSEWIEIPKEIRNGIFDGKDKNSYQTIITENLGTPYIYRYNSKWETSLPNRNNWVDVNIIDTTLSVENVRINTVEALKGNDFLGGWLILNNEQKHLFPKRVSEKCPYILRSPGLEDICYRFKRGNWQWSRDEKNWMYVPALKEEVTTLDHPGITPDAADLISSLDEALIDGVDILLEKKEAYITGLSQEEKSAISYNEFQEIDFDASDSSNIATFRYEPIYTKSWKISYDKTNWLPVNEFTPGNSINGEVPSDEQARVVIALQNEELLEGSIIIKNAKNKIIPLWEDGDCLLLIRKLGSLDMCFRFGEKWWEWSVDKERWVDTIFTGIPTGAEKTNFELNRYNKKLVESLATDKYDNLESGSQLITDELSNFDMIITSAASYQNNPVEGILDSLGETARGLTDSDTEEFYKIQSEAIMTASLRHRFFSTLNFGEVALTKEKNLWILKTKPDLSEAEPQATDFTENQVVYNYLKTKMDEWEYSALDNIVKIRFNNNPSEKVDDPVCKTYTAQVIRNRVIVDLAKPEGDC